MRIFLNIGILSLYLLGFKYIEMLRLRIYFWDIFSWFVLNLMIKYIKK